MRGLIMGFICLVLLAVVILAIPSGESRQDVITFHRYAPDGPIVTTFNEGETVFVNITDGRSVGGAKQYYFFHDDGTYDTLACWDNANNVDPVARDGFYTGAFTAYVNVTPQSYHQKIQIDGSGNYTVMCDLDRRGDPALTPLTFAIVPFELFFVTVDEPSRHVFFDNDTDILYYSNDQFMRAWINIILHDTKPGASSHKEGQEGKSIWGETAFGGETPLDTSYIENRQWDMMYNITINETCDGILTFWAIDNQNNMAYANLTVILDNDGPDVSNVTVADIPHHVGSMYPWWRPSVIPGGTLNVTWFHTDEAGPETAYLFWDSSVDVNDQMGIDPGLDFWEQVYGLNDDGTCFINITILVEDRVANNGSDYTWIAFDETPPNIVDLVVAEYSPHIYFNGALIFSNDQAMSDTFTFLVVDDEAGSGRAMADSTPAFGDAPSDNDYSNGHWDLPYTIDTNESTGPITITVYDKVGNSDSTMIVNTILDNIAPSIGTVTVTENSPYLHLDGTLFFGDDMTTVQYADFNASATDGIGLHRVEFSNESNLAFTPPTVFINGTSNTWIGSYGFDAASEQGRGYIVVTLYDLVANSDSYVQLYQRDILAPSISTHNFVDGEIVRDTSSLLLYTDPWQGHVEASITDAMTSIHRVDVYIDGGAPKTFIEPGIGVFSVTSELFNGTGWHSIVWRASDHLNNTRWLDTSILRSPNSTQDPYADQVDGVSDVVNANLDRTWSATITTDSSYEVWGSVMTYPINPITLDPAFGYTDPNRNYTTFHYLDIGVNNTDYNSDMNVRIYYTGYEIDRIHLMDSGIIGLARWDGADWHWLTASNISTTKVLINGMWYSGYVEATIPNLYNSSNIVCIASWKYRLEIIDSECITNLTIFKASGEDDYTQRYTIEFKNIGTSADDYWVNVTGPDDWFISWVPGGIARTMITSVEPGENATLYLYVTIPRFGAVNTSSGGTYDGKAYPITVEIESFTDTESVMNTEREDEIVVDGFIRRTDLSVVSIEASSLEYLPGENMTIWVAVYNGGNYTQQNVLVDLYMTTNGGEEVHMGTMVVPTGDLEPLTTGWVEYNLPQTGEESEYGFRAVLTYGGDEIPDGSNEGTFEVTSTDESYPGVSGGVPAFAPVVLGLVLMYLYSIRRREDEE